MVRVGLHTQKPPRGETWAILFDIKLLNVSLYVTIIIYIGNNMS